jgi:EAL domain-containing protein (putative c-di-GMP-specific phosphodiesterase class I)/GGDEF domain-containing protein
MSTPGRVRQAASREEYLRLKAAVYDPGTGLDAAPVVMESVRALFHKSRSVGLLCVELDPAGRVEAVYGWQVVDGLLQAAAAELRAVTAETFPAGAVLCQSGVHADVFLMFLPLPADSTARRSGVLAEARRVVDERLGRRFRGPDFRSMAPRPAPSVGSATVVEHPFYRIERQIYRAVEEARQSAARAEAQERASQQAELKRIIRDQNIDTVFQPIVHLETESILGYEALSRGPRDTPFEAPGNLFACSREAGMARELDLVCQKATLRHARRLAPGDKLFLNALPSSLLDPGFREGLLADLPEDFPVSRSDIVLEIADRNAIEDYEAFGSEVADLRAQGFEISIDDVGKASSSLESLSQVHPDFIKVDASLVRNVHQNLIKQELLRSLCQVARAMGATVIAEGIETREELEAVRRCGVVYGQGYFFYKPSRELPRTSLRARQGGDM